MSRSVTHYAASTVASRSHQQLYPRQQATSRSLSRSHEERALRSVSSSTSANVASSGAVPASSSSHHHGGSQRQSLTSITTLASKNSLNQQQMLPVVPPPASYGNGSNPVIQSSLSNSITSSTSGSKNALAASITQQVRHLSIYSQVNSSNYVKIETNFSKNQIWKAVSLGVLLIAQLRALKVQMKSSLKRLGRKVFFLMSGAKSSNFFSSSLLVHK